MDEPANREAEIYTAYHRIFDCNRHGWTNLQSMQLNVPFANDHEFARLYAAVRLLLPILPALAARSPTVEGGDAGWMDFRMESHLTHQARVPLTMGKVIRDTASSRAAYERDILTPMYREVGALDAQRILQHEHARPPLQVMLDHGPLARRVNRAIGPECSKKRLVDVYKKLCDCLEAGTMFLGLD